jgi:chemotaxis protein MotB
VAEKKEEKRPIIVKKVKKVAGGHHGGAWKVAYADFVTAMMAFFLLLWLLSTSSKATLEGISEYFTPTVGLKDSQGIGFKGGTSATEGTVKSNTSQPGVVTGATPAGETPQNPENKAPSEDQEDNMFKQGASALREAITANKAMAQYSDNISIEQTPDGLRIDLMDSEKYPMFEPNSANLTQHGQALLARMSTVIKRMPNYITVTGHTDASPVESGREGYSAWELSTDRANAARRFLVRSGIEPERPTKIVGMADKDLLVPGEPRSPRNRRISILLMKGSHLLIPGSAAAPTAPAAP